jgi:GAF domain-containing protein/HAMP domain-containing protein
MRKPISFSGPGSDSSSARTWLTVAFVSSAVLPLLLVGILLVVQDLNVQQWQALSQQRQISESVAVQISMLVHEVGNILAGLTRVTRFQEMSMGERQTVLSEMMAYQNVGWRFERFIVLDKQGREQLQVTPQGMFSGAYLADRSGSDVFTVPRDSGAPYYHLSRVREAEGLRLMVSVPIFDLNKAAAESARLTTATLVEGVIVAEVGLNDIQDMLGNLQLDSLDVGDGGLEQGESAYIINEQGQVLAAYPSDILTELADSGAESYGVDGQEMPATSFEVPEQQGLQMGLGGKRAILATAPVVLGTQTLYVVAEKSFYATLVPTMVKILVVVGTLIVALIAVVRVVMRAQHHIIQPLETLAIAARATSAGDLSKGLALNGAKPKRGLNTEASLVPTGYEEIRDLAHAFNSMTVQVRELIGDLESQVAAYEADLERSSLQLEAVAKIARLGSAGDSGDDNVIQDVSQLLDEAVAIIVKQFSFHHVRIFLLDESKEHAILRAASSQEGRQILAQGYRMVVSEGREDADLVAQVVRYGEPRFVFGREDVTSSPEFSDADEIEGNTLHSVLALPLKSRGEVIGVLEMQDGYEASKLPSDQSVEPESFSDDKIAALQMLADQVAMAVSNITLYQQAQRRLEIIQRAYGELSQDAWEALLQVQDERVDTTMDAKPPELEKSSDFVAPSAVRESILDVLQMDKSHASEDVIKNEEGLVRTLMDQLAVALHSARLYQDTQQRVAREQLMRRVTAHMHETLDMDLILKTAVQDIREVLDLSEVTVRLAPQSENEAREQVSDGRK